MVLGETVPYFPDVSYELFSFLIFLSSPFKKCRAKPTLGQALVLLLLVISLCCCLCAVIPALWPHRGLWSNAKGFADCCGSIMCCYFFMLFCNSLLLPFCLLFPPHPFLLAVQVSLLHPNVAPGLHVETANSVILLLSPSSFLVHL